MRKLVIFVLSVMILTMVGCGKEMPSVETSESIESNKVTEVSKVEESMENTSTEETTQATEAIVTKDEKSENQSEQVTEEQPIKKEQASKEEPSSVQETEPAKKEEVKKPEQPKQEVTKPTTEEPKNEEPKKEEPKEEPKPAQPSVEQPKAVAYDPNQVVALATSKTKALGKISIPEDMDQMLENGEITKEEYDKWYPYDGAGYYSVFVETDLNEAATTSGRKLGSVEGIADHIAGMLALETGPYFYIEYAGITTTGGRDYYEFRCYRA